MNTLLIHPDKFDDEVWQTKSDFNEKQYNEWLKESALPALKDIYSFCEEHSDNNDYYFLGDIINMLSNTEIKFNVDYYKDQNSTDRQ